MFSLFQFYIVLWESINCNIILLLAFWKPYTTFLNEQEKKRKENARRFLTISAWAARATSYDLFMGLHVTLVAQTEQALSTHSNEGMVRTQKNIKQDVLALGCTTQLYGQERHSSQLKKSEFRAGTHRQHWVRPQVGPFYPTSHRWAKPGLTHLDPLLNLVVSSSAGCCIIDLTNTDCSVLSHPMRWIIHLLWYHPSNFWYF